MSLTAFATLARVGRVVHTDEAAAALDVSLSQASHTLARLERQGMARRVRRGVWIVGTDPVDPLALVDDITRPYPGYVSFRSALNVRGIIDQLPRDITIASLASARRVQTPMATYAIHQLPPALFGGWIEHDGVKLARAEKALFDLAYVSAVHRGAPHNVPELELPRDFDRAELERWLGRIESDRLRTLTRRGIGQALEKDGW